MGKASRAKPLICRSSSSSLPTTVVIITTHPRGRHVQSSYFRTHLVLSKRSLPVHSSIQPFRGQHHCLATFSLWKVPCPRPAANSCSRASRTNSVCPAPPPRFFSSPVSECCTTEEHVIPCTSLISPYRNMHLLISIQQQHAHFARPPNCSFLPTPKKTYRIFPGHQENRQKCIDPTTHTHPTCPSTLRSPHPSAHLSQLSPGQTYPDRKRTLACS